MMNETLYRKILKPIIVCLLFISILLSGQEIISESAQVIKLESIQKVKHDIYQKSVQKNLQVIDQDNNQEIEQVQGLELDSDQLNQLEKVYVDWVYDGDTFSLMDGRKVRLLGIDTAEMNWDDGDPDFYAREAFDYTKEILLNKYVYLQYDQQIKDNYDRTLAYVFLEDGTLLNLKLLQDGYASLLLIPPNSLYDEFFKEAAGKARKDLKGIWNRWNEINETLPQISPEEAKDYMGEEVIVEGLIDKSHDKDAVLLFDVKEFTQETEAALQVVIFEDDFKKFDYDPLAYLIDRRIKVSGQVEEYKGQIEIIVDSPLQIMVLDEENR